MDPLLSSYELSRLPPEQITSFFISAAAESFPSYPSASQLAFCSITMLILSPCSLLQHSPNKSFQVSLLSSPLYSSWVWHRLFQANLTKSLSLFVFSHHRLGLSTYCQQESPKSAVCSHAPFVECKTSCLWRLLTCSSSLMSGRILLVFSQLGEAVQGAASSCRYLSIWARL